MHALLQPFKYNIPFYTDYLADVRRYQSSLLAYSKQQEKGQQKEADSSKSILSISAVGEFSVSEWETVISLLFRQSLEKENHGTRHHIRDRWSEISTRFSDPFSWYLCVTKSYRRAEKNQNPFSSKTFDALFLEITRDNIVTEVELSFLREKARDYGVSETQLEKALERANPALHAFSNFVSEVCRDGIVTENERFFLEEKAITYNIPIELALSLLDEELKLARNFLALRQSEQFYELVTQCLILHFVSREHTQVREVTSAIEKLSDQDDELSLETIQYYIDLNRNLIIESVEGRIGHVLPDSLRQLETHEWVSAFDFKYRPLVEVMPGNSCGVQLDEWSEAKIDLSEPLNRPSDEGLFHIYFNGFDYYFIESDTTRTLFTYQVNGSKIFVSTSSLHPLHSQKDQQPLFKFIVTLIAAKMMDERIAIDDFFDTLHFLQTRLSKEDRQ